MSIPDAIFGIIGAVTPIIQVCLVAYVVYLIAKHLSK
jgi:hypothetical protein